MSARAAFLDLDALRESLERRQARLCHQQGRVETAIEALSRAHGLLRDAAEIIRCETSLSNDAQLLLAAIDRELA